MNTVSLSASARNTILALNQIKQQQEQSTERLATGLKYDSANSNVSSYYTASDLSQRAYQLSSLMDNMTNTIQSLKVATEGVDYAIDLLNQAKTITTQTQESDEITQLQITKFNDIITQYNSLINDTTYKNTNLLKQDTLNTTFNEDGTSNLTIMGVDATAETLGINGAQWQNEDDVILSAQEITQAITELQDIGEYFGSHLETLNIREGFTDNLVNILQEGYDDLVLADTNEEAAILLSLQTREQLALDALSITTDDFAQTIRLFY